MKNGSAFDNIRALVREIKEAEAMLRLHKQKSNPVDDLMSHQFRVRQQRLAKDLLVEVLRADISLKSTEKSINAILDFLKKNDNDGLISNELQANLSEAVHALAA